MMSLDCNISFTSALILRTMLAGTLAGAKSPNQGFTSKSLKPASAIVGTLLNEDARLALVTAMG